MLKEEFVLENVIIEALFVTMPHLSGKDVNLLLNVASQLPARLEGDRAKVGEVLKTVLDHGILFVKQGCILLHILQDTKTAKQNGLTVRFEMEEIGAFSGEAFDNEDMRTLVHELEGSIHTEILSAQHHVIKISIPLSYAEDTSTVLANTQAEKLKGKKVLFLAEDEHMLESLGYLFYAIGVECVHVSHADEVLEKLERYQEKGKPFDLLICDCVSDNMAMLKVAHEYRSVSPSTAGVLMVSTFNGNYLCANDIIEVGSLEFIDRIVIPSEFIDRICSFLDDESGITDNWNLDDWTMQSKDDEVEKQQDIPDFNWDDLGLEDFSLFEGVDET